MPCSSTLRKTYWFKRLEYSVLELIRPVEGAVLCDNAS